MATKGDDGEGEGRHGEHREDVCETSVLRRLETPRENAVPSELKKLISSLSTSPEEVRKRRSKTSEAPVAKPNDNGRHQDHRKGDDHDEGREGDAESGVEIVQEDGAGGEDTGRPGELPDDPFGAHEELLQKVGRRHKKAP